MNASSPHQYAPTKPSKIAVIGGGISGVASAWFLSQEHNVTLFEQNNYVGGHTNTVVVEDEKGQNVAVDTGFIVYNEPNYPQLTALLEHLEIRTQETEMSFSVSIDQGAFEYSGNNLSTMFAQRKNIFSVKHWRMINDILRFNRQAKYDLDNTTALEINMTLGDYLAKHHFSNLLKEQYLLPMAAAIWSCPVNTMLAFPVSSFLQFFKNHGLLNINDRPQWKTINGGSQQYCQAILNLATFQVKKNCQIVSVEPTLSSTQVKVKQANGEYEVFDHVILAGHADQSYKILDELLKIKLHFLSDFKYQPNTAYLHSDLALMPKIKKTWAAWNYLRDTKTEEKNVSVTYWMNLLQNLPTETPMLVALNPTSLPDEGKVMGEFQYEHPVFDTDAKLIQQQLPYHQGQQNIWFAGAWTGYGFHEDGLQSAVNIANWFNVALPWKNDLQEIHYGA